MTQAWRKRPPKRGSVAGTQAEGDGKGQLPSKLRFAALPDSIQGRDRSAKQVRRLPQVEPIFFEQGFGS